MGETEERERSTSLSIEFLNEEEKHDNTHDSEVKRENVEAKQVQASYNEDGT
jgi:hypothetical protein